MTYCSICLGVKPRISIRVLAYHCRPVEETGQADTIRATLDREYLWGAPIKVLNSDSLCNSSGSSPHPSSRKRAYSVQFHEQSLHFHLQTEEFLLYSVPSVATSGLLSLTSEQLFFRPLLADVSEECFFQIQEPPQSGSLYALCRPV